MIKLTILVLAAAASSAHAVTYDQAVSNYDAAFKKAKLNNILWQAELAASTAPATVPKVGNNLVLTGTGLNNLGMAAKATGTAGGKPLVIDVAAKFVPDKLKTSLINFAKKAIPGLSTGFALYDLVQELPGWGVSEDPIAHTPVFTKIEEGIVCLTGCYEYKASAFSGTVWRLQIAAAGADHATRSSTATDTWVLNGCDAATLQCTFTVNWTYSPTQSGSYQQTAYLSKQATPPYNTSKERIATAEEFAAELSATQLALNNLTRLVSDSIQSGEIPDLGTPTVTGPATTEGTTTTTSGTNAQGEPITTTQTTTNHFTYSGDNITHNTTTTTSTTNNTTNVTTTQTSTTSNAAPDPVPTKSQCELTPDIIGCSQFGTPDSPQLSASSVAVAVTAKVFAGTGSCPAPLSFTAMGQTNSISYQPICDQMVYLRALMLALAGLLAAYILADSFRIQ